jgi:hypothetical protein
VGVTVIVIVIAPVFVVVVIAVNVVVVVVVLRVCGLITVKAGSQGGFLLGRDPPSSDEEESVTSHP